MVFSVSGMQSAFQELVIQPSSQRVTIPSSEKLTFIYVAIARSNLGNTEIFHEQTIEDETTGNFEVELVRPANPIGSWTVMVQGYRDGIKVFYFEKNAASMFS